MRAPALPATDALLSSVEVGLRLHVTGHRLKAVVESSPALRAGRRYRGTRAYFLESAVVRHLHVEMPAAPATQGASS